MANSVGGSSVKCSVCWEEVSDACGRTIVKLRCSHLFHLDCIGSAFNASGSMQCPNCRKVEIGLWRRFENSPEESIDEDVSDEDDDHLTELQLDDHFYPLDELLSYLLSLTYHDRNNDPNFNHYMTGPLLPSENDAFHVLPHHYQRNCSCMFHMSCASCALHMAVSQISAQEVPSSNMRTVQISAQEVPSSNMITVQISAQEVPSSNMRTVQISTQEVLLSNMRTVPVAVSQISAQEVPSSNTRTVPVNISHLSIAHQAILYPWHGAQSSFRPSIGSGSLRNNSSIHGNFEWVQPPRSSQSLAMGTMSDGRSAVNGMQRWSLDLNAMPLPEQTGTFSYIRSLSGSLQSHPEAVNFHHPPVHEGNNVMPPQYSCNDMNPF